MNKIINCLKEDNPVINKKLKAVSIEEGNKIGYVDFYLGSESDLNN